MPFAICFRSERAHMFDPGRAFTNQNTRRHVSCLSYAKGNEGEEQFNSRCIWACKIQPNRKPCSHQVRVMALNDAATEMQHSQNLSSSCAHSEHLQAAQGRKQSPNQNG
jgi:hypothetical protein